MIVALSGLCVLVYGLQTVLSLAQSATPPPPPQNTQDSDSGDTQADPKLVY